MVHATTSLAYPKDHMFALKPTCILYIVIMSSMSISCVHHEVAIVRNRLATELVMLKVHNVKLSFDIWLVLYIYFILYS